MVTAVIAGLFAISLFGLIAAGSLRARIRPETEEFGLINEGLAKQIITDDDQPYLYSRSNEHRMSLLTSVWYEAYLQFDDYAISRIPVTANVGEAAAVVVNPVLRGWTDSEPLLIIKLETRLDNETFIRLKGARSQGRSYAMNELTKSTITWNGAIANKKYFAAELLAPSFTVAGTLKQRQLLAQAAMNYAWNICPNNPGNHELGLRLSLENEDGSESVGVGIITRTVRAVSHGSSSQRNVDITLKAVQIIAAVLGILLAHRTLGVLG